MPEMSITGTTWTKAKYAEWINTGGKSSTLTFTQGGELQSNCADKRILNQAAAAAAGIAVKCKHGNPPKPAGISNPGTHLGVVGAAVLGHSALTVHQEAVPPPLFGQSVLVAFGDVVVQLGLLIADGFDVLGRARKTPDVQQRNIARKDLHRLVIGERRRNLLRRQIANHCSHSTSD